MWSLKTVEQNKNKTAYLLGNEYNKHNSQIKSNYIINTKCLNRVKSKFINFGIIR